MQTPFFERTAGRYPFAARPSPVSFRPTYTPARVDAESSLSDREVEVLRHVAEGLSNKEIASQLAISNHTVARHVTNIMRKLDAANRAQAATLALRSGLISY